MTTQAQQQADIYILKALVKRFVGCMRVSGTDAEFAAAAVVHEVAAIERLSAALRAPSAVSELEALKAWAHTHDWMGGAALEVHISSRLALLTQAQE